MPLSQINTNSLGALAITTSQIANNAVTAAQVANNTIGTPQLNNLTSANVSQINTSTGTPSFTTGANTINFGTQSIGASSASTMKNRIINGAMVIDQRNAGGSISVSSDSGQYGVDRMNLGATGGGVFSSQQSSTAPAGFSNSLKLTVTTASSPSGSNYYFIRQRIEGYNTADLGWGTSAAKTVTLSFWVQSSVTGTYSIGITATGTTATYCASYTITSANTWQYVTITIPGPTIGSWATTNSPSIELFFALGLGTTYAGNANTWTASAYYMGTTGTTNWIATNGATFYITGVQLEVGSAATSFDFRHYTQELQLCQRYYQAFTNTNSAGSGIFGSGYIDGSAQGRGYTALKVTMRANPTVTGTGLYIQNNQVVGPQTSFNTYKTTYDAIAYIVTSTGAGFTSGQGCLVVDNTTTSASITCSAEL